MKQKPYSPSAPIGVWIPVSEMAPPMLEETPETQSFYMLRRYDPTRDGGRCPRVSVWFGTPPRDATHWCRLPAFDLTTPEPAGAERPAGRWLRLLYSVAGRARCGQLLALAVGCLFWAVLIWAMLPEGGR